MADLKTLESDYENFERELKFEQKYCARLAAFHQNSKDTIKALKVKTKEIAEKVKIEKERLKKLQEIKPKGED